MKTKSSCGEGDHEPLGEGPRLAGDRHGEGARLPTRALARERDSPEAIGMSKCALVMAGGTCGHIFPGLAVAEALRERAWRVHWLGGPGSMESQLVPPRGFEFETIEFSGVRGKGLKTLVLLPLRLLKAFWQSIRVVRRVRPDVVVGLGGY